MVAVSVEQRYLHAYLHTHTHEFSRGDTLDCSAHAPALLIKPCPAHAPALSSSPLYAPSYSYSRGTLSRTCTRCTVVCSPPLRISACTT